MKLTTTTHVSVDGLMQGLGAPDEDRSGGFERGGSAPPLFYDEAAKAKSAGELQVHGSGNLARWLLDNQLVDEITLLVYPLVVGQGTRLFPDTGPDAALDLVDSRSTPSGVSIQVYRPTGRPQYATATAD